MNGTERSSLDLALFAVGAVGFLTMAAGAITTTIVAVIGGLLLIGLAVAYFAVIGD